MTGGLFGTLETHRLGASATVLLWPLGIRLEGAVRPWPELPIVPAAGAGMVLLRSTGTGKAVLGVRGSLGASYPMGRLRLAGDVSYERFFNGSDQVLGGVGLAWSF